MTRRERLAAKAEKRREWAASRSAKASAAMERADLREEKSGIPFGQPVLVGHHSERRHRRAIERADRAIGQASEHYTMAKHHAEAADGIERALERSIFSDDPDAIEALQAKLAGLEAERERIKAFNARCRAGDATAIAEADRVCHHTADDPRKGLPPYKLRNLAGEIGRVRKRIEELRRRAATTAKAEAAGGMMIDRGEEWCSITFAEKPDRAILNDLRAASFRWGAGRWVGRTVAIPASVLAMEGGAS